MSTNQPYQPYHVFIIVVLSLTYCNDPVSPYKKESTCHRKCVCMCVYIYFCFTFVIKPLNVFVIFDMLKYGVTVAQVKGHQNVGYKVKANVREHWLA